tara:strand:- start:115 stop:489 length:375 start_codon:yes stop_codon:yes gene_type:complete
MEKIKILVVEDDSFLLEMYATKLRTENFKVLTTTNGQEALKISRQEKPALILLDLNLPEIDGFTVLEELKGAKETKDIPVIVLTNFSNKEDINRCLNLGAKDYLIKAHFIPSEVIAKVKKILKK